MKQRYDLAAFGLLVFACVFLIAITVSPKAFQISDWQPLMAAVLTLGGAGIVYRGATLAYRAAMARIELDRNIHRLDITRRTRAICIRVSLSMHTMTAEARWMLEYLAMPPIGVSKTIDPKDIKFQPTSTIIEAWDNLEILPAEIARMLATLRVNLLNFELNASNLGDSPIEISQVAPVNQNLRRIHDALMPISVDSASLGNKLREFVVLLDD